MELKPAGQLGRQKWLQGGVAKVRTAGVHEAEAGVGHCGAEDLDAVAAMPAAMIKFIISFFILLTC